MTEQDFDVTTWRDEFTQCSACGDGLTLRVPTGWRGMVYRLPPLCATCIKAQQAAAHARQRTLALQDAANLYARLEPHLADRDALIAALADYLMEQD